MSSRTLKLEGGFFERLRVKNPNVFYYPSLEVAQRIAAHSEPRTTKLYDRRGNKVERGEIVRIRFKAG